tara:strand:+ start:252 stop:482 length:231 start_codon:yes stop_codon:yes gene_type:complete
MITIDNSMTKVLLFYIGVSYLLYKMKPDIMFDKQGKFKPYGVGKEKTVTPFWLITLLIGLVGYLFIKVKSDVFVDN